MYIFFYLIHSDVYNFLWIHLASLLSYYDLCIGDVLWFADWYQWWNWRADENFGWPQWEAGLCLDQNEDQKNVAEVGPSREESERETKAGETQAEEGMVFMGNIEIYLFLLINIKGLYRETILLFSY